MRSLHAKPCAEVINGNQLWEIGKTDVACPGLLKVAHNRKKKGKGS